MSGSKKSLFDPTPDPSPNSGRGEYLVRFEVLRCGLALVGRREGFLNTLIERPDRPLNQRLHVQQQRQVERPRAVERVEKHLQFGDGLVVRLVDL